MSFIEIKVESGLDEVIEHLEQVRIRAPLAISRAVHPKKWKVAATRRANEVLTALAETMEEHELVAKLAGSVTTAFWSMGALGMEWNLTPPVDGLEVAAVMASETSGPLFQRGNREEVNQLYGFVLQWVKTEKDKDRRDTGKSDENIAWTIVNILLGDGETMAAARAGLLPHIQTFIDQKARNVIGEERLQMWLHAVLDAWGELVEEQVVDRVADEVLSEFGKK